MEMRLGDLVTAALPGDYGKPRLVFVVQDDAFDQLSAATVLPLTTDLSNFPLFRITVEPSRANGLRQRSQIVVDKAATVVRAWIRQEVGGLDRDTMDEVDVALARFLGLAESSGEDRCAISKSMASGCGRA
jgi:mRNA interferase MazF